jgi:uncharacterized protein YecE (DUF72 family)
MPEVRVGVSGWRYPSWRGDFYPAGLVQRRELEYVAFRMSSVELNGSFYSLQRPSTFRAIVDQTPDDFPVAVKGGRYITHMKRLAGVESALANFFASGVLALGEQLGPVLWQLPPGLKYDEQLVAAFFDLLPRTTGAAAELAARHDDKLTGDRVLTECAVDLPIRHALEPRHASFGERGALALLEERDVALVASDSPGSWPYFEEHTADFAYVRLHGHTELYASGYSPASLDRWAEKTGDWRAEGLDVYVYFDNDARGRAPHDAVALLERLGWSPASAIVSSSTDSG